MKKFQIDFSPVLLQDLHDRLANTRWPAGSTKDGWMLGTNQTYLQELTAYWQQGFDWPKQQAELNKFNQFHTTINGIGVHFIHERGEGPKPIPLLLSHGWPDSFHRFYKLIPLLTNPTAYGGRAEDAFDVIVPSLPGFGFSDMIPVDSPYRGETAHLLHQLMTTTLGYSSYGAHGGDIGGIITERLASDYPTSVLGIHLVGPGVILSPTFVPPADLSGEEQQFLGLVQKWLMTEGAYLMAQATKPYTLAQGLADSPAGLAAWLIEKFRSWSDSDGQIESRFTKDELLTNIMLYWATNTIGSSFSPYYQQDIVQKAPNFAKLSVPTGFAIFPQDILKAPRSFVERFYEVRQWTEMPSGGHFTALEEPELLAEDLRSFFRLLRKNL